MARLDAREPSARLAVRFERWRSASPRHEAAYLRLAAVWARLDRLALGGNGLTPERSGRLTPPLKRLAPRLKRG
ncbi:MAG: FecR/PupR family sigma factor regulator [Steroidobacteraceae bacterium]